MWGVSLILTLFSGSWFTLERWIASGPFANAVSPGQADLHVAQGWNAREILEYHWDTWITDNDWQWLAQHGFNTVRIPVRHTYFELVTDPEYLSQIGYYHVVGLDSRVIEGTDFADYGDIYSGAWERIDRAITTAAHFGFGVLIGSNPQFLLHSPLTSSIQICTPLLGPKIMMPMLERAPVASNFGSSIIFVQPCSVSKSSSVIL